MAVDPHPAAAEVVLHQEQLRVGTRRVPTEKILVRRRVVTEVRQIEVTVRREEVEVHRVPLDGHEQSPVGGPPEPLVILLSEEVPVVRKGVRLREEVVVRTERSQRVETVRGTVRRDEVEIEQPGRNRGAQRLRAVDAER